MKTLMNAALQIQIQIGRLGLDKNSVEATAKKKIEQQLDTITRVARRAESVSTLAAQRLHALKKIQSKLRGIDETDLTTAERQIVQLLKGVL